MDTYQHTHSALSRGFAARAPSSMKLASIAKQANRRWLEDSDLVKLCQLFKENERKKGKKSKRRSKSCS